MMQRWMAAVVTVGLLAVGCSDGGSKGAASTDGAGSAASVDSVADAEPVADEPGPDDVAKKPWTVLLYSMADTNLEPDMMADLDELGDVGTNDNVNMVALVDRSAGYSAGPVLGLDDWQGAKLLQVNQGSADVLQDYGDLNTGDPAVLADFIAAGIQNYPAEHYALILSDHGAAWPGVGADESAGNDTLNLAEMSSAISSGLAAAGVDQLDLLGLDACLMSSYEVASAMAPVAQRMVASQELEPGHGWDYHSFQLLADDPAAAVDVLGQTILDGFEAQAKEEGTSEDITLHLLDLTAMGAVDDALTAFVGAVDERAEQVAPVIGATRAKTLEFGRSPDPTESTHMADLGQLVSEIGIKALDLSDQADAVLRAVNDVVLASVKGPVTLGATGLSIYFPETEQLLSAEYGPAVGDSAWVTLLADYYGSGKEISADQYPTFLNADGAGDVTSYDGGVSISGTLDPAAIGNITDATISYGIFEEDGSITYLGMEQADLANDGTGFVQGTYDLSVLRLTDGVDTVVAYLELTYDDDAGVVTISVPMGYYGPQDVAGETYQDVLLVITLDSQTFEIVDQAYYAYQESFGGYGALTADPAGLIVPEVLNIAADGTEEWVGSEVGLYADLETIQLEFVRLDPGTEVYLELAVTDFGDHTAVVYGQVVVS